MSLFRSMKVIARSGKFGLVFRNVSALALANVFIAATSLIRVPIIARYLQVEMYGVFGLVIGYTNIVSGLIDFRIWETAIRYALHYIRSKNKECALAIIGLCYSIDGVTGIISCLLILATSGWASDIIFHDRIYSALVQIFGLTLLFGAIDGTSTAVLRIFNKFGYISIYRVFLSAMKLMLVFGVVYFDLGIKGLLLAELLSTISGSILVNYCALVQLRAQNDWRSVVNWGLLRGQWKDIISFIINTNINASLQLAAKNLDILLLGSLTSLVEVSYYRLGRSIVEQLSIFIIPIHEALYPEIARNWSVKSERKSIWQMIMRLNMFFWATFLIIAVVITFMARQIVGLIGGVNFASSSGAVAIMIWGISIWGATLWTNSIILSNNKPGWMIIANLVGVVVFISTIIIFSRSYGYVAASIGYVLYFAISSLITLTYVYGLYKLDRHKC